MNQSGGALTIAADRLRDVPGFPRRPGRPRKPTAPRKPDGKVSQTGNTFPRPLEAAVLPRPVPSSSVLLESRPSFPPRLLGPKDAGAYLGSSAWTARQLVNRKKLDLVKLPGIKRWLVDRADLDALIEQAKATR